MKLDKEIPHFVMIKLSDLQDYHTVGPRAPQLDFFQDYVLKSSSEDNGKTFLEFERDLQTIDIFYGDAQFYVST